jgi:hypothetical protein
MGMDVIGKAPTGETGRYFRANVWCWSPLWEYCEYVAPALRAEVIYGDLNEGDGLDAAGATALADQLTTELELSSTEFYVTERQSRLDALPMERCDLCQGTGVRRDQVAIEHKMPAKMTTLPNGQQRQGWCNGCDGQGFHRSFATRYHLSVEIVTEFRDFLRDCGGFAIW